MAELGSLEPLVHEAEQGYAYYRIEFLANYPEPDETATGDVGGKIARVYFSVQPPGTSAPDGGSPGPDAAGHCQSSAHDGGDSCVDQSDDEGCGCRTGDGTSTGLGLLVTVLFTTWFRRRPKPGRAARR